MSGIPVARCAGAPRDLGLDQGRAAAPQVRAALRRGASGPARPGGWSRGEARLLRRDLLRYYPHLGERMLGLARGARVEMLSLAGLLATSLEHSGGLAVAASAERTAGGALLARSVPMPPGSPPPWLRHSAPENDHRSLEVVRPWGVVALCGVNEHGLAATATTLPAPAATTQRCRAPLVLLVQEVLQRFDRLAPALEWCQRRPAGGLGSVLLADASGAVAGVVVSGTTRRVLRPCDGVLLGLAPDPEGAELAKACSEVALLAPDDLAAATRAATPAPSLALLVDPAGRRLAISSEPGALRWHGAA